MQVMFMRLRPFVVLCLVPLCFFSTNGLRASAQVDVLTQHNDNARTGVNPQRDAFDAGECGRAPLWNVV